MCKEWKQKGCNHHFPELNKKNSILKNIPKIISKIFTPARFSVVVFALTIVIGVTYLMQTNVTATKGYKIRELEQQMNELKDSNKKLNLKYIELQSMANVIGQVDSLDLVAVGDIETITTLGSAVALR